MHSFGYRVNELLKLAVKILAFICIFSSFSDICNLLDPTVDIQVVSFDSFVKTKDGDEEVNVALYVTTDLKSLFTWNTKQVFVFVAAEYETPDNAVNQCYFPGTILVLFVASRLLTNL